MTDSYGDGWQGHYYRVTDEAGTIVASDQPRGFSTQTASVCLAPGTYTFEVGGDDFDDDSGSPQEIGWSLCGMSGGVGGPETFVVNSDGTCHRITCVSLAMTDSWGDGWTDFAYQLATTDGAFVSSGTLATGSYGTEQLCLSSGHYSIAAPSDGGCCYPSEVGYSVCGVSGGVDTGEEKFIVADDGACESPGARARGL